jgi:2-polyprenyl-3-methyl-5-hydroxy-6-metoxy-1,4-benzoquinol methylase
MAISFSKRSTAVEIMDDLACQGEVVNQTLRELDFINHWLGGNVVTVKAVDHVLKKIPKEKEITIGDLGCGSGEMLRLLAVKLKKQNRNANFIGVDANANIINYASRQSKAFTNVSFFADNILEDRFKQKHFDVVLATLFFHHFETDELIKILRQLKQQTNFVIINDIHRHPFAYYSIKWLTQLFSKSAMVRFDAPLSVLRSFTQTEWEDILQQAGFTDYEIHWRWAFRWQIVIETNRS